MTRLVNSYRCTARVDVGRCALLKHDQDIAHAYSQIVTARPWRCVLHRWDDTGRQWTDGTSPRLPWAAMHVD